MSYRPPSKATSTDADGWTTIHKKPEAKSKWGQSALKPTPKKAEDEFPALGSKPAPAPAPSTNTKPSMAQLMKQKLAEEEEERQRREAEELRKAEETEAERVRVSGILPLYSVMRAKVSREFREPEPDPEYQEYDYYRQEEEYNADDHYANEYDYGHEEEY